MKNIISLFLTLSTLPAFAHKDHGNADLTHLKFHGGSVHAHVTWEEGPRTPDESRFRIEWKKGKDHSPLAPPGGFEVSLYAPEMGHGSLPVKINPAKDRQDKDRVGGFVVSRVFFAMDGAWDVLVTLKGDKGQKPETQKFSVVLGDPSHTHGK